MPEDRTASIREGSSQIALGRDGQSDDIELSAILGTIWRGRYLVCLIAALAVLAGGCYAYILAEPRFRSTAVVIMQTRQDPIVDLQGVMGGLTGETVEVNSEVEVLRARGLMERVVERLDLANDPEFNAALRPETWLERAIAIEGSPFGSEADRKPPNPARVRDATVSALIERVTIRNVPNSLVFDVTVETASAEKSALLADTIVELYILNQLEVKFEATEQAKVWLADRLADLQRQLELAEASVSAFNATTDLVSVEALRGLDRQLKEQRDRIAGLEVTRAQAQAQLVLVRSARTRADQAAVAGDAQLTNMLLQAETDAAAGRAFDARFRQLSNRADLEAVRLDQQITVLRSAEASLQEQIGRQSEDLITLQQLTREAEATRQLYEYFLTRFKETSAQQGIQQADSRILSGAVVPSAAASPRKSLILVMSGVVGLMIGVGVVLWREAAKRGFQNARDIETVTGLAVLGQIPRISARTRKRTLAYLSDKPNSMAAEAVRNLRTSLLLSTFDGQPQVIVLASALPGEGKTTNAVALAQNIGTMGRKVLFIEADIRRRILDQYLDKMPEQGIVSVLSGETSLDDAIHKSASLKADVLVADKTMSNPSDLFSSEPFEALIRTLRNRYDTIIIDTPPVLIVPDARIIAQSADTVLFTVKWETTSREQVEDGLDMFRSGKASIGGIILSQIDTRRMRRYGGAYGAYASGYYAN